MRRHRSDGHLVPGAGSHLYTTNRACSLASSQPMPAPKADDSSGSLFSILPRDERSEDSKLTTKHPTPTGLLVADKTYARELAASAPNSDGPSSRSITIVRMQIPICKSTSNNSTFDYAKTRIE